MTAVGKTDWQAVGACPLSATDEQTSLPQARRRRAATGEAAATDRALAEALAGKRVLIAYGLVGELLAAMHRLGVDYMKSQAAWLRRDIGAEVAVVRLRTAAAVADNAQRIAEVLCQDARPAVVIAHSKGGLETLTALINRRAAGAARLSSPFSRPFSAHPWRIS